MPITRSVGKGRKPPAEQEPSSSESTAATSATGTSAGATTATASTTTGTTATGTTTTESSNPAASVRTTVPSSATTRPKPTCPVSRTVAHSDATTLPADAVRPKTPAKGVPPPVIMAFQQRIAKATEVPTVKQPERGATKIPGERATATPRPPSKKGSTHSKSKTYKLAKAKEELLRLQVELAAARLAALETEETEDEEEEDISVTEINERVDNWLDTQPMLAIANEPHCPVEETATARVEVTSAKPIEGPKQATQDTQLAPVGVNTGMSELASAITRAIQAAQRPKFIELPFFNGSYQEWLPFRAAYKETESMFTAVENMNRLRRNLKGKAREAVEGLLIASAQPTEVIKALESRFGRPESIAMMEMESLRSLQRLTESPREICVFATKIANSVATLKALSCTNYLYNPEMSKTVIDKLTPTLRYRYYDFAATENKEDPDLVKLNRFLKREADLCGPYALPEQVAPYVANSIHKRTHKVHNVTDKTYTPKCPVCDETGHSAPNCREFKKADENSRWDIAKSKRLCFRCLKYRNRTHSCKPRACEIDGCKYYHNRMLHYRKTTDTSDKPEQSTEVINSAWTMKRKQSYLKILPVQIKGPKGTVKTFALLDDGSTVTLIDSRVTERIGATGPVDPLKIETINDMKTSETSSRRVTLKLKGSNNTEELIKARTVKNLQVSSQRVSNELLKGCQHLEDIRDYLTYPTVKPQLLIGQDNWHLLLSTETRKGDSDQPVASLTSLGWVLHGYRTRYHDQSVAFVSHVTETAEDNIEKMIKEYFEMDALCIQPKKPKSDADEQALRILEETTTRLQDGRFETSLLWKHSEVEFPNNYESSLKRLFNIESKLDRNPVLKAKYSEQMEALTAKGYAELAPKQKTLGKTWYLPHFAVVNPMKPEKLRVVHDAAAKTKGVALNDMLLKGPDLLQSLPGVVMRFRQHKIAVTADIKEMFMQVKLRTADRDALRYLWRGDRRDDRPPEEYRMTSLIFGASSSPSTAIYVKNVNAEQYKDSNPEAAAAIVHKHYVDDYLDSFETLEEAVHTTQSVRKVHRLAHFELKQWMSNSTQLLEALGEHEQTKDLELYKSEEKIERVLGVIWKIDSDKLTFNLNFTRLPQTLVDGNIPTKRQALRIVMSLFDPLGLASPVTVKAKQLLQEVWRRGTAWDDRIDNDLGDQWQSWIAHLKNLRNITIPRRYLGYSDAATRQLHIFTDASESAYAAVLFWRVVMPNGEVNVSLVLAKAKVAPLKLTSIPRLELQAAVMGARLAETVIEEHERKPDNKVFWTDSSTVLSWIRQGSRSYKPYVAHRLAALEEATKVSEWRWVPTKLNVADDATRDVPINFTKDHRWYKGPDFLLGHEDIWPNEPTIDTEPPSGEEKVTHINSTEKERLSEGLPDVRRFSNWNRLRLATARIIQFIALCRPPKECVNYRRTKKNVERDPSWNKKTKSADNPRVKTDKASPLEIKKFVPPTAEQINQAEGLLIRSAQEDSFAEEIDSLKNNRPIAKQSRLYQLSVEYKDKAIKLRSRIDATQGISESLKYPMILDGDHRSVKLWIEAVHRQLHHAGVEATMNECRQQYWILRLRPTVRSILRSCLFCRMRTQVPPHPRTGDLPECRLGHHKRPFTFTGVDYFGPLSVTVGRTRQKRYVALFTCLTTRAVHLEIAGSLSADSAVMALRRMIARRGCPSQIWSDNGTNLKAADKELRQNIDAVTEEEASRRAISWRYIPPGAPFMGGAWERMVRSVKTALNATLHERHPTEEVLSTLLTEVEFTVNSRPLTHLSVNPDDPEALTPNHFLLGGPARVPLPGTFTEKDTISRSSWRAAQRLADVFWTRWLKEYLPELQHRREPHGRGPAVQVNDLVQIVDANLPRNVWARGRIIKTYPGPDSVVRAVDVQTQGGVLRRPVRKLIILPLSSDSDPAPKGVATESHGGRMCGTE